MEEMVFLKLADDTSLNNIAIEMVFKSMVFKLYLKNNILIY